MSVLPAAPPVASAERRGPLAVAVATAVSRIGDDVPGRAAEAAPRPHRAAHPRGAARAVAARLRQRSFTRLHAIPTGNVPYLDFLAPGILAQSALFIAIFYGIQIIWERDAGVLAKLLVTPTPRVALVAGEGVRGGHPGGRAGRRRAGARAAPRRRAVGQPAALARASSWRCCSARRSSAAVDHDRRAGAVPRPADGHRAGDHDAAVLRVERALPGGADARLAAGHQPHQPAELRGRRAARAADRHARRAAGWTSRCWSGRPC